MADNAEMTGIEVNTPRKSPGKVLPPESEGGDQGLVAKAKAKLSKTALGEA